MNLSRAWFWCVLIIAALVGAHFAVDMQRGDAPRVIRRVVLASSADRATVISVSRTNEPPTRLVRDGGWRVVSPIAAAAAESVVLRLCDALAYAPVQDELADAELLRLGRTRRDFGIDSPSVGVTVGEGDDAVRISFGDFTPARDGVYAVVDGLSCVLVVPTNVWAAANLSLSDLRCRDVFSIGLADVESVDMRGEGRFVRCAKADGVWQLVEPRKARVSVERVESLLSELTSAKAVDFVWTAAGDTNRASVALLAGYGLDPDSCATVTLKGKDADGAMLSFGRSAGDGMVYALLENGKCIVTLPAGMAERVRMPADALIDTRLFPIAEEAVSSVQIQDDGDTSYALARTSDGSWRLDSPVSAPADGAAVRNLLAHLLALKTTDVESDGVRVAVGKSSEQVTVSRSALFGNASPDGLRSLEMLRIRSDRVRRIVVTDADRPPLSIAYDADRASWTPEDVRTPVKINRDAVVGIVSSFDPLQATRIVRLKVGASDLGSYGLDTPVRTIAIDRTGADSVRHNLMIGDVADGGYYATFGTFDAVFVLPVKTAGALLAPVSQPSAGTAP